MSEQCIVRDHFGIQITMSILGMLLWTACNCSPFSTMSEVFIDALHYVIVMLLNLDGNLAVRILLKPPGQKSTTCGSRQKQPDIEIASATTLLYRSTLQRATNLLHLSPECIAYIVGILTIVGESEHSANPHYCCLGVCTHISETEFLSLLVSFYDIIIYDKQGRFWVCS